MKFLQKPLCNKPPWTKGPIYLNHLTNFNFFGYIEHFLLSLLTFPWVSMQDLPLFVFKCQCFCCYLIETFCIWFCLTFLSGSFRISSSKIFDYYQIISKVYLNPCALKMPSNSKWNMSEKIEGYFSVNAHLQIFKVNEVYPTLCNSSNLRTHLIQCWLSL